MRKPVDVTFGLNDTPTPAVLVSGALQQTAMIVVFVYPAILLAREVQASPTQTAAMLSLAFLVCGASALIQSAGRWGIGAGYLAPGTGSATFLAPSLLAVQSGGLPLAAGMTLVGGFAMALFARTLHRARAFFPPEIAGAVVIIIGMAVTLTGVRALLRTPDGAPPEPMALGVAALTLAIAVSLSVWGRGVLRGACVLIAMLAGTAAAAWAGLLPRDAGPDLAAVPVLGLPDLGHVGYAFDPVLLPAFLIAALANSLKTVGLVTTLQKLNDADWVRPDPRSIAGGVAGDGVATMLAGLAATAAPNVSATNVTIQAATGVTSRSIGYATAALCVLLACFPRLSALLAQVPAPVIAAILLHAGGLMLVNGMELATSRMLDSRKSFVVGFAVVTTLAVEAIPELGSWVSPALQPFMSATALGTIVAVALNAVLRIGVRREVSMSVPARDVPHDALSDFVMRAGAAWGARRDVLTRAAEQITWCVDTIAGFGLTEGEVTVRIGFDEFRIDVRISYAGPPIALSATAPTADEMLADEGAPARLAGHMIRRRANKATVRHRGGVTQLDIVLDH
ncbi:uracil-xanthine permease family protein [Falsiroseomonas oryzae]|uniref:uracil-xanthine permease family protein n=1 Tax=Falsiroseomonas oryzae TaxID=2766473 RepID=UPI0022EA1A37|nr:solute carrier family 23 protein [Roseomonas sp. MO-31]